LVNLRCGGREYKAVGRHLNSLSILSSTGNLLMSGNGQVRVNFNHIPALKRAAPRDADRAIAAIAFEGEAYAKRNMTVSPSSPGEFPGVDTGTLKNSIHVEDAGPAKRNLVAGTDYAYWLEFGTSKLSPRPFMSPTAHHLMKIA